MASLKDIKYKVVAIRKTKQITRAMNMVSTAKLRSAQRNAEGFRAYQKEYVSLVENMLASTPEYRHELLQEHIGVNTIALVLVTPDRGLCGAFAGSILQSFKNAITEYTKQGKEVLCYCVGRKGFEFAKKQECTIIGHTVGVMSAIKYQYAQEVANTVQELFLAHKVESVQVIYGHFTSLMVQSSHTKQVLPIGNIHTKENTKVEEESCVDTVYEPSVETLLAETLPRVTAIVLYDAFLDTIVSEHAARMIAMNNATKNCDDLIASFSRLYNKVRQAAVTKELMDIVGGAEALNT